MRRVLLLGLATLCLAEHAAPARAAWPNSPFVNVPLCTAAGPQYPAEIVSDGAGGAIVAWADGRGGLATDIYAQHVLASGALDPAWPVDGRAVCTAANTQVQPQVLSDGAGGAIITWSDLRSGYPTNYDIYAQHVLASGAVDPAWPSDGRALCAAVGEDFEPHLVSDGAGGAIVTWYRSLALTAGIYAQHVLASGAVDPAWPVDGRALCTAPGNKIGGDIMSDGAGGAIVAWTDGRSGLANDIYAQHVLASGVVDPGWPVDGRPLCVATNNQYFPQLLSDGAGGALVTWSDSRGGAGYDIYAQHVLATGAVDPAWPADGRALCAAANDQIDARMVSDGANGAIISWNDDRGADRDIYAQHMLATGATDPAWPVGGRALCAAAGDQYGPRLVSDGAGGALVTWSDARGSAGYDIYAQHVPGSGIVDPAWPTDGRALCTATGDQRPPGLVSDGSGGAIVAWYDYRAGVDPDIYAQRIGRYGYLGTPEAEIASVKDVPNDQGGQVKLSWNASYLEADPYDLVTYYKAFRSVPPNLAASLRQAGARVVRAEDPIGGSFDRPGDLLTTVVAGVTYYWEYMSTVNADFLSNYSCVAPTTADSIAGSNPETAFMVQARTAGTQHWESLPALGYSVDNLAPLAPQPFTGTYSSGVALLHWGANVEADLAGYRLYRGTTSDFVIGPASLVSAQPDTGYADPAGAPYWYKLTAIDRHGNESPVATLLPSGTTDVGGATSLALSLAAPRPNPAGVATVLGYALPRAARVRLALYDVSGRRVRVLAEGVEPAGEHAATWDLSDDAGHAVGAGLYVARLEVEGRVLTRRVMALR